MPQVRAPAVLRGQGPVPLGGVLSGDPAGYRLDRSDKIVLETCSPKNEAAGALDPAWPSERVAFQGLPARICWLGYGESARRPASSFNEAGRRLERIKRPASDRPRSPRLRLGGVTQPGDRGYGGRL